MEEIGVQLIVEGLDSFVGDMGKAKGSLLDMVAPPSLLQGAFGGLWDTLTGFASWVGDVLTFTIGGLLKDAIEGVISVIGEMIGKTIEAGKEFQTLKIRLNGINLQDMVNSGMDYNEAMTESVKLTQEQLAWLQKLAAATPFDNKDISNIYTLARSYGFADEEARELTSSLADFTSGMGLTDVEMKRIVINLGQMKAAGKITGRELADMARGSFVPVGEIMKRVAKMAGKTTEELDKMRAKGEAIPPDLFTRAFMDMVAEEPRFNGASERMARTFGAATDNVMDLATSFGGLNIATPILDELGGRIADFMDQFIRSDESGQSFTLLGQRLLDASVNIGAALVDIIDTILSLLPASEGLAETLVGALEGFASWLTENKDGMVQGIKDVWQWLMNLGQTDFFKEGGIISKLMELWDQLFAVNDETGKNGFQELADAIGNVGKSILGILDPFLKPLGINISNMQPTLKGFVDGLNNVSKWIDDNKETLQFLLGIFIAFQIIQTITNLVFSFILSLVGLGAMIVGVIVGFTLLIVAAGLISSSFVTITAILFILQIHLLIFQGIITYFTTFVSLQFQNLRDTVKDIGADIIKGFETGDWGGAMGSIAGRIGNFVLETLGNMQVAFAAAGELVVSGFADGFFARWTGFIEGVNGAVTDLINIVKAALGIQSPSKVFSGIGENMVHGMANGIADATSMAVGAMDQMVAAVTMPAINAPALTQTYSQAAPSSISSTYQSNQTNNLNIHTNASSEPIIQDFQMLQSLSGI